jgi:hypothetical protein
VSPLRRVPLESSRGGEDKRGVCLPNTLPRRPPNRGLDQGLARVPGRLRATESFVEAHVSDEALEPRDKGLPGVRIPSPRVYKREVAGQGISREATGSLNDDSNAEYPESDRAYPVQAVSSGVSVDIPARRHR